MNVSKLGRLSLRCSCGGSLRVDVWSDMQQATNSVRGYWMTLHSYPGHSITDTSSLIDFSAELRKEAKKR